MMGKPTTKFDLSSHEYCQEYAL